MLTFLAFLAGVAAIPTIRVVVDAIRTRHDDDLPTTDALRELVRKGTEEHARLGNSDGQEEA